MYKCNGLKGEPERGRELLYIPFSMKPGSSGMSRPVCDFPGEEKTFYYSTFDFVVTILFFFFNLAFVCTYLFLEDPQQIVQPIC